MKDHSILCSIAQAKAQIKSLKAEEHYFQSIKIIENGSRFPGFLNMNCFKDHALKLKTPKTGDTILILAKT